MAEDSDHEHDLLIIGLPDSESSESTKSARVQGRSQRQPPMGPSDAPKKKYYCRNCGGQGHIAKFCYKEQQQQCGSRHININNKSNNNTTYRDGSGDTGRGRAGVASRRPLVDLSDNAGFVLWRDKKAAYSTFEFTTGFEVATEIYGERSRPVRIGHFTQTYIEISRPQRNGKLRAAIWAAEGEHNDAARRMLEEWRDEVVPLGSKQPGGAGPMSRRGRGGRAAPKNGGVITDAMAARRKFTRDFAPDEMFAKFCRVDWCLKDDNLSPENVLGHRLEALDKIRMDHQVYIKLSGKSFGVFGANEFEARKACIRLQNVQWNAVARDCPSYQFYLAKPVTHLDLRSSVVHSDYVGSQRLDGDMPEVVDYKVMMFGEDPMDAEAWSRWTQEYADSIERNELMPNGTSVTLANVSDKLNALYVELWFMKMMKHQPYYLGHIHLRASIGTCLMTRRIAGDNFDLSTFCQHFDTQNRDQNGIESIFTKALGERDVELELLQRFMSDKAPLEAQAMSIDMYDANGNLSLAPHSTSVQFSILNGEEKYELHLTFENFQSRVGIATWIKTGDADFPFLDINILDLKAPNLSYNLRAQWIDVLGNDQLWKLPASWTRFADLIRINADAIRNPCNEEQAFDFPGGSSGSLPITDFVQKQVWKFYICDSSYVVELHRLQEFECSIDDFGIVHSTPYEPRWGCEVYHPVWDRHLAANAALKLGYRASWSANEHEFFPLHHAGEQETETAPAGSVWVRGSGIREWLRSMEIVERIVSGGYEDGAAEGPEKTSARTKRIQISAPIGKLIDG